MTNSEIIEEFQKDEWFVELDENGNIITGE